MHTNNKAVGSKVKEQSFYVFHVCFAVVGFGIRCHGYIDNFIVIQDCGVSRRNKVEVVQCGTEFIHGNIPVGVVNVFGDEVMHLLPKRPVIVRRNRWSI